MKKHLKLLIFALLFTSCAYINNKENSKLPVTQIESLDKTDVFNALFKPEVFEWCIWKPTVADSLFPVSDDGYCHTKLERIMNFQDNGKDKALLIFATYDLLNGKPNDAHYNAPYVSIAIFEKSIDNNWILEKFEKNFGEHGSWGELPDFKLTKIGKHFFLMEDWGYTSQGVTEGWNIYFYIPTLVESLRISSLDQSGSYLEENEQENWSEEMKDISDANSIKVLITKIGTKYGERINESKEYYLTDSCIFRPAGN